MVLSASFSNLVCVYSSSDRWQVEAVQEVCTYVVTGVVGIFPRVAVIFLISFVEKMI
jgi:hypothetical protein